MRVKLRSTFFAPTGRRVLDKLRSSSGRRWKAGVHENMPDELRHFLPKDAVILDGLPPEAPKPEEYPIEEVRMLDPFRAQAEASARAMEEAEDREKERLRGPKDDETYRKRVAAMAHARAAKAAKQGK